MTFRWQIERNDGTGDYINIPGSFGTTFTPNDEHTGLRIRVVGSYVDAGGVTETACLGPTDGLWRQRRAGGTTLDQRHDAGRGSDPHDDGGVH